ncbi:unnamed protein product [Closterium sp. NIES-54]
MLVLIQGFRGARVAGVGGAGAAGAGGARAGGVGGTGAARAGGTGGVRAGGAGGTRAAGAGGAGAASAGGTRAGGAGGTLAAGAGVARARGVGGTGVAGAGGARAGGVGGTGAGGAGGTGATGAGGTGAAGAGGTGAAGAGGSGAGGNGGIGGAGAGGAGAAGDADGTGTALPSSTGLISPLLCPPPDQSQPQLLLASLLPTPSPYPAHTCSLAERRKLESRLASPVCTVSRTRRSRPPPVSGTHVMALRPSSVPHCVALPSPLVSSLPDVPDPESDLARVASPTVTRLLASVVTDPSFESTAAFAHSLS